MYVRLTLAATVLALPLQFTIAEALAQELAPGGKVSAEANTVTAAQEDFSVVLRGPDTVRTRIAQGALVACVQSAKRSDIKLVDAISEADSDTELSTVLYDNQQREVANFRGTAAICDFGHFITEYAARQAKKGGAQ